jgi:hypothetical protein
VSAGSFNNFEVSPPEVVFVAFIEFFKRTFLFVEIFVDRLQLQFAPIRVSFDLLQMLIDSLFYYFLCGVGLVTNFFRNDLAKFSLGHF